MRGASYDADFYRREIEKDTLTLSQAIDDAERRRLQTRIDRAKEYLAELTKTPRTA